MSWPPPQAGVAGRFALQALVSEGEVCAAFRRSFYLKTADGYACVGDASLGRGPLNALVRDFRLPAIGARMKVRTDAAVPWTPLVNPPAIDLANLKRAKVPAEGLGCLALGKHNSLSVHAQPALEAIERWL